MRRLAYIAAIVLGIVAVFGVNMYLVSRNEAPVDAPPTVSLTDLAMYYDDTGDEPPWVVSTKPFAPVASHSGHGFLSGKLWFRFRLSSDAPTDPGKALVRVGLPNLDDVTLNYRDRVGQWQQIVTGDLLPLTARPWTSPRLGFVVNLADLAGQPVYLSVQSTGTLLISLAAGELESMMGDENREQLLDISYFAANLVAIVATAALYLIGRDRLFLLFLVAQLFYLIAVFSYTGYLSVLAPNLATDLVTTVWVPLATMMSVLFHFCFFRALKVIKWVTYGGIAVLSAYLILFLMVPFLETRFVLNASWYLGSIYVVLMAFGGWSVTGSDYLSKRTVRTIYTAYAIVTASWILPAAGLLPAPRFLSLGPGVQGLLNITLIFSLLLRFSQQEKLRAQEGDRLLERLRVDAEVQQHTSKIYRDLLWMISHEVGTSLTVLRLGLSKPEISAQNKERMHRALGGLEDLVTSFSRSERLELGEVTFNIGPVDLVELIECVAGGVDANPRKSRLRFVHRGNAIARADEAYMRTIVSNLLTNAIKYSPEQTPIDVTLSVGKELVVLQVENQCLPQAIPDIDRVFDRFYRDAHVLDKPGTGLGLTIVQQLMRLLGGECNFEIRDEDKVRVTIWFPIQN